MNKTLLIAWYGNCMARALDESSRSAMQPIEQLSRMQQVLDAWQAQVPPATRFLHY